MIATPLKAATLPPVNPAPQCPRFWPLQGQKGVRVSTLGYQSTGRKWRLPGHEMPISPSLKSQLSGIKNTRPPPCEVIVIKSHDMCMIILHGFQVLFILFFYPLSLKTLKLVLNKWLRPGESEDFLPGTHSGPIQTHSAHMEHLPTCGPDTWLRRGADPSTPSVKMPVGAAVLAPGGPPTPARDAAVPALEWAGPLSNVFFDEKSNDFLCLLVATH